MKVENRAGTLEGELRWNYQREATKKAIYDLSGVLCVSNSIKFKSEIHYAIEKEVFSVPLEVFRDDSSYCNGTQIVLVEV